MGQKKLRYLILSFLVLPCFPIFAFSSDALRQMQNQDRQNLEELFGYFVTKSTFPYTLFGDKPVSWLVISLPQIIVAKLPKQTLCRFSQGNFLLDKWQTWKKHEKKFPHNRFLFIEENSSGECRKDIFLINKRQFIKVVDQHQALFQKLLRRKVSGNKLLEEVTKCSSLRLVLENNHLLLGILFGFGLHNASLYQEREDIRTSYEHYQNLLVEGSQILQGLKDKEEKITNILQFVGEESMPPLMLCPVQFVADLQHPETKILQKKYKRLRGKISSFYAQGKFSEPTLSQLISEEP